MMIFNIILIILAVIFAGVMLWKKVNLGIVMITESIFLLMISKIPFKDYISASLYAITNYSTIKLIIVFVLIMLVENVLRKTGMIKDLVNSLKEMIGNNRIVAGVFPVVVGLLPSPGGARFSCPMVEEVAINNSKKENLTYVNYWFRHVWMDGFFLYPGVILAAELLNVSVMSFFVKLLPFMLLKVVIGYFMGLKNIEKEETIKSKSISLNIKVFLGSMFPILAIIVVYMALQKITNYSLEIALASVSMYLLISKRYSIKKIIRTIKESFPYKLILIIFGVMIFKEVLFETGLLDELPNFLDDNGIPIVIAFLFLPFITGFFTGITVSFVSISFPILLTLGLTGNVWLGIFAYMAGNIGMMVTPVHLCMIVSSEYFKHPITLVMKKVILSEIPQMIIATIAMILLLR